jgi:hypothetical protein
VPLSRAHRSARLPAGPLASVTLLTLTAQAEGRQGVSASAARFVIELPTFASGLKIVLAQSRVGEMGASRTPKQAIRESCRGCVGLRPGQPIDEVRGCGGHTVYATGRPCPFYDFRLGGRRVPARVIKAFCVECQGSAAHARECPQDTPCHLFPFRHGRNPNIRGASKERMAAIKPAGATFPHVKTRQDGRTVAGAIEDSGAAGPKP